MPQFPLPLDTPVPSSSFLDLLEAVGAAPRWEIPADAAHNLSVPEGTTVLALRYQGGVIIAGDRQATEGHMVAHRFIQKVFPPDRYSAVAVAGTGLATEMVRLFQVELEHYEKLENRRLRSRRRRPGPPRPRAAPDGDPGPVVVPLRRVRRAGQGRAAYTYDVVGAARSRSSAHWLRRPAGEVVSPHRLPARHRRLRRRRPGGPPWSRRPRRTPPPRPRPPAGILPTVFRIDSDGIAELSDDEILPFAETALEDVR